MPSPAGFLTLEPFALTLLLPLLAFDRDAITILQCCGRAQYDFLPTN
jgi:hypothetical protein